MTLNLSSDTVAGDAKSADGVVKKKIKKKNKTKNNAGLMLVEKVAPRSLLGFRKKKTNKPRRKILIFTFILHSVIVFVKLLA